MMMMNRDRCIMKGIINLCYLLMLTLVLGSRRESLSVMGIRQMNSRKDSQRCTVILFLCMVIYVDLDDEMRGRL